VPRTGAACEGRGSEANPDLVDGLAGNYGQHRIRRQDGRLYLDWFGVDAGELVYTESGVFRVEGIKDYRVEPKLQNGKVAAIQEHYFDGRGLNLHPKIS